MAAQTLQGEIERILQILSALPGSKNVEVKTRRYPRFLPGDAGTGYSEKSWHLTTFVFPVDLTIPADSEDILVTWHGEIVGSQAPQSAAAGPSLGDLRQSVSAALAKLQWPTAWDYDIHVSGQNSEARSIKVQVLRRG